MRTISLGAVALAVSLGLLGCPAPDYPPDLVVKPASLDFQPGVDVLTFAVSNVWTRRELPEFTVTSNAPWILVTPSTGRSTGPSNPVTITVTIDRAQLLFGAGSSTITVSALGVQSATVAINALRPIGPDFRADTTIPYVGQEVTFTDGTLLDPNAAPVTAWAWSFGDGATSTEQNPRHTYTQLGSYTVSMTVTTATETKTKTKTNYISTRQSVTPQRAITIDGAFDDWANVQSYSDPEGNTHDTDHNSILDIPAHVDHPDADLLEYKFTHDSSNLYAYFRAKGRISNTQSSAVGTAGRYYAIVTIDVDNKSETGYWLHEGGYYPTGNGYDMNMEIEWYDNAFNTGHYINHGATNQAELEAAFLDQMQGIVRILPGSYDYYTQWVMFDDDSIVFVLDKGPVYQGIVTVAVSPDGHEAEMKAPFRGFMKDPDGNPIMALGKVINVSFSLEASSELAPGREWASNTAAPIVGYFLTP
ncbi:MAG: PKD domain-containing protein [Candidatus Hydrogenedentes bacterium]|nr:PKD domain-containing protein [Candidatus Hydrogenedentota bacterium]